MFVLDERYWYVEETKQKGKGVHAKVDIAPCTVIGDYVGKLVPMDADLPLYDFAFTDDLKVYAEPESTGVHLINHSCGPNCETVSYKDHILFVTSRKILKGEELTIDYFLDPPSYDFGVCTHECMCESPLCRGTMHAPAKLTARWEKYFESRNEEKKSDAIYRALGHTLGVAQTQDNLSEAKRRYAGSVGMRATQEGVRLLHEAIRFAEEAGVSAEQSASARTIVRANIELGCALRALARETYEGKVRTASSLQRLIIESENALRKAASHAYEKALTVLHLDALANIPFLYYYVNNVTKAKHSLDEIWGYVPQNYLIQPSLIEPVLGSEPQIAFWRHIAKLTTLQGHIAYDRFQEFLHDEDLRQCAEAYMLAMEYNERYSHDEMAIQNSRQQIYDR